MKKAGETLFRALCLGISAILLVMSLLFILVPALISSTSFMILPSGALAIGLAWLKFRKTGGGRK